MAPDHEGGQILEEVIQESCGMYPRDFGDLTRPEGLL